MAYINQVTRTAPSVRTPQLHSFPFTGHIYHKMIFLSHQVNQASAYHLLLVSHCLQNKGQSPEYYIHPGLPSQSYLPSPPTWLFPMPSIPLSSRTMPHLSHLWACLPPLEKVALLCPLCRNVTQPPRLASNATSPKKFLYIPAYIFLNACSNTLESFIDVSTFPVPRDSLQDRHYEVSSTFCPMKYVA